MDDILKEAQDLFDYTKNLRRDFHRHPELGFQEVRTASIVARELGEMGLEVATGVAKTGVVAMLEGSQPGPVVLLRFDMDALPIQEETGAEYASQTPGLMHACGHDGHVAIGLGVARLLHARREQIAGAVKLVFQPAEEGLGGGKLMVEEGVLDNPRPDLALALHVWNDKPLGWLGIASGPVMAAADTFSVRISGKGGHGALPELAVDPVVAAAQVITALQTIVSRNVSPLQTAVVSVTSVRAGEAFNVIPPFVDLKGTIRTFDSEVRAALLQRFEKIIYGVSEALACQAEVEVEAITPAVINNGRVSARVVEAAVSMFPDAKIQMDARTMGSEDMAYLMQDVPGCYFFVGSANSDRKLDYGHHHPKFDFDENVLPAAVALMAAAALDFLTPQKNS
jgi:amidohydrolase